MTGAIAAFPRRRADRHSAGLSRFGNGNHDGRRRRHVPVYQLMEDTGEDFRSDAFLPASSGYYADRRGQHALSMPFQNSCDADDVLQQGVVRGCRPATRTAAEKLGPQVEGGLRGQIMDAGAAECGFTTGWVSWAASSKTSRLAQPAHRKLAERLRAAFETELTVNGDVQGAPLGNLASWQEDGRVPLWRSGRWRRCAAGLLRRRMARCT